MEISKIVEILRKMEKNALDCAENMKEERSYALARQFSGEALAIGNVIFMLTEEKYAEHMAEIYCAEG